MNCDCSIDGYDDAKVYREEFPVARKQYRCCECGETINPGQKYHKAVGLWDLGWDTYRTCMPCYNIRNHYCRRGYIFGRLSDTLSDCFGIDYTEIPEDEED